ncbi:unnamed protein product, partial [Prorocentrum cordatum]
AGGAPPAAAAAGGAEGAAQDDGTGPDGEAKVEAAIAKEEAEEGKVIAEEEAEAPASGEAPGAGAEAEAEGGEHEGNDGVEDDLDLNESVEALQAQLRPSQASRRLVVELPREGVKSVGDDDGEGTAAEPSKDVARREIEAKSEDVDPAAIRSLRHAVDELEYAADQLDAGRQGPWASHGGGPLLQAEDPLWEVRPGACPLLPGAAAPTWPAPRRVGRRAA